ncbi:glycoside hydrolase domain-containing protein [Kitasatospora sp. NPDC052896]|uniref:glycoside hydrolase domain-containing protein n=1 Tax=Kitasatospora sp. NPDC052896 TaxID=3364061 RepID=UPI0037C81683
MRRRLTGIAAATIVAAASLSTGAAGARADGATRLVEYQGYQLRVPADWRVVDLGREPDSCVRLDRHTVYLGTPGAEQDCPAHLPAGRGDNLLIEPVPASVSGREAAPVVEPGRELPAPVLAAGAADHELRAELRGTGLQVTASYGTDPRRVNRILAGARLTEAAPVRPPRPAAVPQAPGSTAVPGTDAIGKGFDTCAAPSATTMSAWLGHSPYRSVGIYIGGPSRACAQPNLTADWVGARAAQGWTFLPVYVGPQATIGSVLIDADPTAAGQQGGAAAADAANKAAGLGFRPGSVLYTDLEAYSPAGYSTRVLAYLAGWTNGLHAAGYRAGVYSSAGSGIRDLAGQYDNSGYPRPDVVWSAAWNADQTTSSAAMGLPGPGYWPNDRRVHQYSGGVSETWGGSRLNIDGDALDVGSPAGANNLAPGQRLDAGQSVSSSTMTVTMQADGNLVAYAAVGDSAADPAMWSTGTQGNPGAHVLMQWDGNLVVYRPDGTPIWSSATYRPGSFATVQADGNFVVYAPGGGPTRGGALWDSGTYQVWPVLPGGTVLGPGEWTEGALTRLMMQADGNLVMYRRRDGAVLWASDTEENPGAYAIQQGDGNFVVYQAGGGPNNGGALWASGTWGHPGAYAVMQDDGNLVVYRAGGGPSNGGALWESDTYLTAR